MITKPYCNICFSLKEFFNTLLLPCHCMYFLLKTKLHINTVFSQKIVKLKHKKLNARH